MTEYQPLNIPKEIKILTNCINIDDGYNQILTHNECKCNSLNKYLCNIFVIHFDYYLKKKKSMK